MELPLSGDDRNLLASILMKDDEELTAERLEGAVRALRRIHLQAQAGTGAARAASHAQPGRRPNAGPAAGKNAPEAGPDGSQPGGAERTRGAAWRLKADWRIRHETK